jgi:hypothetical protein
MDLDFVRLEAHRWRDGGSARLPPTVVEYEPYASFELVGSSSRPFCVGRSRCMQGFYRSVGSCVSLYW